VAWPPGQEAAAACLCSAGLADWTTDKQLPGSALCRRSGLLAGSAGLEEQQQEAAAEGQGQAARPGTMLVTGRAYRAQLAEWLAFLAGIKGARSLFRCARRAAAAARPPR
jgi:hypothetical protein